MQKKQVGALSAPLIIILTAMTVFALLACAYVVYRQLGPGLSFPGLPGQKNSARLPLPYREEVRAAAERYGVEEARIYAVIQTESSFRENAVSNAGAVGLMQMLPSTYEELCERRGVDCNREDLKDPAVNIDFCTEYLAYLYNFFGDWNNAHMAYHAGISNVRKWLEDPECSADGKTVDRIPNAVTARYLERINAAKAAYAQAIRSDDEARAASEGPSSADESSRAAQSRARSYGKR